MVYGPAAKVGKAYKLARPFKGPYHVMKLSVELSLICRPNSLNIRIAMNQVRHCS